MKKEPLVLHHLDKWVFSNLDLVEESLESNRKAVILIAGASSSGKSYSAEFLKNVLEKNNHRTLVISLDHYNVGLSRIIPEKVNRVYYNSSIDSEKMKIITSRIKNVIYEVPFAEKYSLPVLNTLRISLSDLFSPEELERFLSLLSLEWQHLNFDEPTVYDMKEASQDIKRLLNDESLETKRYSKVVSERIESNEIVNGRDYDCLILEGIYALDPSLIDELRGIDIIKDFISGNPKSLFLRRIIRDKKMTSASSVFTISAYFKYIVKSYEETIKPTLKNADVILHNDMTFKEMREGDIYTSKVELKTRKKDVFFSILEKSTILSKIYQKDIYLLAEGENKDDNILRIRSYSEMNVNYTPKSLVHKGVMKTRKDDKEMRPINILLNEEEFSQVWKTLDDCLHDFTEAGFSIGDTIFKVKYKVVYKSYRLTLREIPSMGYFIEFADERSKEIYSEIKEML